MNPLVSCIVAVYNGERFLAETLESIFAQTYEPLEVLVVDDGSTDRTREVVERWGARIRYIWQENAGPVKARNKGIAAAQGDLIAFTDADDLWLPDKTARQVARLVSPPVIGGSVTLIQNFWMDELEHEREQLKNHPRAQPLPGYVVQTLMVHRRTFDRLGLFDTTLIHASELDWFLRAEQAGEVIELLSEVLVRRRMHLNSMTRQGGDRSRKEHLRVLKRHRDRQRVRRDEG